MAGQTVHGKLTSEINTYMDDHKSTLYWYDIKWDVQSVDQSGNATVKMVVNRERFRHRSSLVTVDYDSNDAGQAVPEKINLGEVNWVYEGSKRIHNQEYLYVFSDRGEIKPVKEYEFVPNQLVSWPPLPVIPIGVGETWVVERPQGEQQRFELVSLQKYDGETIAWIENKSNSMRYRFLVNAGRYLDYSAWDINRYTSSDKKSFIQSISHRQRLYLPAEKGRFDGLKGLQPNQPGRAVNLIANLSEQSAGIKEYLSNEQESLRKIYSNLFIEHVNDLKLDEEREEWNPRDFLVFARYFQRTGNTEKHKQLLKDGAKKAENAPELEGYLRNIFLLQYVASLAGIGEFEAARTACLAISDEAMSGLSITAKGPMSVPRSSVKSYSLMLLAREQVKAGKVADAIATAQLIPIPADRSAARWIIAMHLAEQGRTDESLQNAVAARQLMSDDSKIFEFDADGPMEVSVGQYRTLAIGKLAIALAKDGDEEGMRKALSMIKDQAEKDAVLVDVIAALDGFGLNRLAEELSSEVSASIQAIATSLRITSRFKTKSYGEVDRMIDSIRDPIIKAGSLLEYCEHLRSSNSPLSDLLKQLDTADETIEEISEPVARAAMIINLASVFVRAGRKEDARTQLIRATEMIGRVTMDDARRLEYQLSIANLLARIEGATEFDALMGTIERTVASQDAALKSRNMVYVVEAYLEREDMKKAEQLAETIDDASSRCKAFAAIGRRYALSFEMQRSRDVFTKAYESAMQVVDVLGLDTLYSKGGAVRYVGHQQGDCDIEGLVAAMKRSDNPNVRSYGLLGGAEAFDQVAASAAKKVAKLPDGIMTEVCEANIACKMIQVRSEAMKYEQAIKENAIDLSR
jgi:hypothetical protein